MDFRGVHIPYVHVGLYEHSPVWRILQNLAYLPPPLIHSITKATIVAKLLCASLVLVGYYLSLRLRTPG